MAVTFLGLFTLVSLIFEKILCTGGGYVAVSYPKIIASKLPFSLDLYFPPKNREGELWTSPLYYVVAVDGRALQVGTLDPYHGSAVSTPPIVTGKYSGSPPVVIEDIYFPGDMSQLGSINIHLFLSSKDYETETNAKVDYASLAAVSDFHDESDVFGIPSWLSILPSIITVGVAICLKQNLLALFLGAWIGATFLYAYNPVVALLRLLDTIVIEAMADPDHAAVMYFCLFIGGMIAVIGKGGGAIGMANKVTQWARTRIRGQIATYMIGVCTFFDDYASCLVAGSTTRDFTGKQLTSREKSSFIVDTNAAAIPSIFPFSSWIGVEIAFIAAQLKLIGLDSSSAYDVFMQTIPYRFYPLLILLFSFVSIVLQRDFGPMLTAERRAIQTGLLVREGGVPLASSGEGDDLEPKDGKPKRWWNAVIPFMVVIIAIIGGMMYDGYAKTSKQEAMLREQIALAHSNNLAELALSLESQLADIGYSLRDLFSAGSPYSGLLWASFLGSATAILLVVSQGILTLGEGMDAWLNGTKSMLFALLILIHAWALGIVCTRLQTSAFVAQSMAGKMTPGLLPAFVFILGALVSFSTGSAWGTMSILFPLMVPLAWAIAPGNQVILLGTISSILSGSVWGNHASPIADSCIMASLACGADHNDHVKTQAVYAVVVGLISVFFCSIPVGMEWYPCWVGLIIGWILVILLLLGFGQRVDDPSIPWDADSHSLVGAFIHKYTPIPRIGRFMVRTPPIAWIIRAYSFLSKKRQRNAEATPSDDLETNALKDPPKASPTSSNSSILREHYLSVTDPYK